MNCPKCSRQNPDDARLCSSCGSELTETSQTVKVTTSAFAITSLAFAIVSLLLFPFALWQRAKPPSGIWLITALLAIIIGIIALVRIGLSAGRVTGKGIAVTGILTPVIFYAAFIVSAFFYSLTGHICGG